MSSILEQLPPEIISAIILHLEVKDILNLRACSRSLYEVSSLDFIWHHLIYKHTKIERCMYESYSPKVLYEKLIHPYAKYLGYWFTNLKHYGGLFKLFFRNGTIICQEIFAPYSCDHFHDNVDFQDIFSISFNKESGDTCFVFLRDPSSNITVKFHQSGEDGVPIMSVTSNMSVCKPKKDATPEETRHFNLMQDKRRDRRFVSPDDSHLLFPSRNEKFMFKFSAKMLPQITSSMPSDAIINPGIFKGSYSDHGVEIVMFQYSSCETKNDEENVEMIQGQKITGDPNIPSEKITFKARLKDKIILTKQENVAVDELRNAETCNAVPTEQPFILPSDFFCDVNDFQFPESCSSRLKAKVQVAFHDYTNPTFIDAHLIIFSQNLCALMMFDFQHIMLFQRLENM